MILENYILFSSSSFIVKKDILAIFYFHLLKIYWFTLFYQSIGYPACI